MNGLRFHGPDGLYIEEDPQLLTNLGNVSRLLLYASPTDHQGGARPRSCGRCHRARMGPTWHPTIPNAPQAIATAVEVREKENHVG
jgi:hypothetical protein